MKALVTVVLFLVVATAGAQPLPIVRGVEWGMSRAEVRAAESSNGEVFQTTVHSMRAVLSHHYGDDDKLDSITIDLTRWRVAADSLTARAALSDLSMLVDSLERHFGLPNSIAETYMRGAPCDGTSGTLNARVAMGCTVVDALWSNTPSVVIASVDARSGVALHTLLLRPRSPVSSVDDDPSAPLVMALY